MTTTAESGSSTDVAAGDTNQITGRVRDASYVGVSTQYLVKLDDGQEVVVYTQNLDVVASPNSIPLASASFSLAAQAHLRHCRRSRSERRDTTDA